MKKIIYLLPLMAVVCSCSHKTSSSVDSSVVAGYSSTTVPADLNGEKPVREPEMKTVRPEGMIPYATAFRMSGDYADNVAVTLNADGSLLYFPDPKDITADSRPVSLGNGWWLNNQGLGPNSVFTTYTFADYAELPAVPDTQQLLKAVIPGAKVTQMVELPYRLGETEGNIDAIKEYLKNY